MRLIFALSLTLVLAGCSADTSDLQQFIARVQTSTPPPIEPYPEFEPVPAFQYSAENLRSPYERPKNQGLDVQDMAQNSCAQPDLNRAREPLEAYGTDVLTIQGFFTSKNKNWVLITASDGSLHRATVGDYLGLFFGRITRIANDTVYYTEQLPDGAGCWQVENSQLTMSKGAGEANNV